MTELESLAKDAFERYSKLTTGSKANWTYLSEERKIAWMKEVIFFMEHITKRLTTKFKPIPSSALNAGNSYAMGYNNGLYEERNSILNFINYLDTDFKDQLEKYLEIQKDLKR